MAKVQNVVNYGVADVPEELLAELGSRWVAGGSLVKPPFVPPWGPGDGSGGGSGGGTEPPPVEPVTLQRVDVVYKPGKVVDFTAIKGEVNDPNGDEAFYFGCTQETNLNGYVERTWTRTFTGAGPFDCSLEDLYGDGSGSAASRKKVTFKVTLPAADADTGAIAVEQPVAATTAAKTTTKKATTTKG